MGYQFCANSFVSALSAEEGGAARVELCDNMAEGGTTPSYGQIKMCVERLSIEIWPIIRPRGGDFLYTDDEFEVMKADIEMCKTLGCSGIVTGILTANGDIDTSRCAELISIASPMPVAFHRAFDMCNDLTAALEVLVKLGFVRVLTSGASNSALNGAQTIAMLVDQAKDRIEIMPGAGINPQNIAEIKRLTLAKTFHASARVKMQSAMTYKNENTKMGSAKDEYLYEQSSMEIIKELTNKLNIN